MWRLPKDILASGNDQQMLEFVLDQLKDPGAFMDKVQQLYDHPETESFDMLQFQDGRVFERYSKPQRIDEEPVGRVWSSGMSLNAGGQRSHVRRARCV